MTVLLHLGSDAVLLSPTSLGSWCHCYRVTLLLRAHHLVVECLVHARFARSDFHISTLYIYIDIDMYMVHRPCYLDYITPQHTIPTSWYLPQPTPPWECGAGLSVPNRGGLCILRSLHYLHGLELELAYLHAWMAALGHGCMDMDTAMNFMNEQ